MPEGPIHLLPSGEEATALAAKFKGPNFTLAWHAECAAGTECADECGAAVMKFEALIDL